MTKAKQFIQDYKRDYSNVNVGWNDNGEEVTWYSYWLSPDDALRGVEIEREEMIEKACDAYCKVCGHFAHSVPTHICRHDCRYFSDFKNYMKGE